MGFETRVIWNTSIPLWDEHFDFPVDSPRQAGPPLAPPTPSLTSLIAVDSPRQARYYYVG